MNKDISKTITTMRFPTCVMVMCIHSTLEVNMDGVAATFGGGYSVIHDYISYGLCLSAVPFMPNSDVMDIIGYFILSVVIIVISIMLYITLQRIVSVFWSCVDGK